MNKIVLRGIVAMIGFYIVNTFIMPLIGEVIFVGDSVTLSYHSFTYTGLILIFGLIVIYTGIIVKKLDEIKDEVNKKKR